MHTGLAIAIRTRAFCCPDWGDYKIRHPPPSVTKCLGIKSLVNSRWAREPSE